MQIVPFLSLSWNKIAHKNLSPAEPSYSSYLFGVRSNKALSDKNTQAKVKGYIFKLDLSLETQMERRDLCLLLNMFQLTS